MDSRNVHAFMLGEHGDSEVAVWSSANISGADLDDFCRAAGINAPGEMLSSLAREVTHAAYAIIERKGATCYGIAMAVRRIAEAIVRDERAVRRCPPLPGALTASRASASVCRRWWDGAAFRASSPSPSRRKKRRASSPLRGS